MRSIRRHLWGNLVLGLGVLWLLAATGLFVTVRHNLLARFDAQLEVLVSEVRFLLPETRHLRSKEDSVRTIDFFIVNSGYYFQIWGPDDVFSDRSPSLGELELPKPRTFQTTPAFWNAELPSGERVRVCAVRIVMPLGAPDEADEELRVGVVVAKNREGLDQSLALVIWGAVAVGLLMALGCAAIVHYSVRTSLQPLDRLGDRVRQIDASSLSGRFTVESLPRELRPITDRLNNLMARLEASFERERRFSANLAHELRTPLAELKTMAEYALRWPEQGGADTFRDVLDACDGMVALLESLLDATRLESRASRIETTTIRIGELVTELLRPRARQAEDRGLHIEQAVPEHMEIRSNAELLRIVIGNLLSNAVEYTPQGGTVRIAADARDGGGFELVVSNSAAGLTQADMPHMFERLWRLDASRSDGNHHGLGLSLARSCAETLSCRLAAELDERENLLYIRLVRSTSVS